MQNEEAADVLLRSHISAHNYGSTSNYSSRSSLQNEYVSSSPCCPGFCIVSHGRRTFCLFVTFDLLLSFILWSVYVKLEGGDFLEKLTKEFTMYKFEDSLMDYLMVAAFRFIILILFYGLIKIRNPYSVAVTTLVTCIYTITKIIMFKCSGSCYFPYILLGESFVIAWVETWFLDFRVLPLECSHQGRFLDSEGLIGFRGSKIMNSMEGDGFLTPSEGSDDEDDALDPQDVEYRRRSLDAWKTALFLMRSVHGWKKECEDHGIMVYSQFVRNVGKVFRAEAEIDATSADVFKETAVLCERIPTWNKCIIESKIIKEINNSTDIVYQVTKKMANGVISSRDFVSVRHWKVVESENCLLSVSTSVNVPWVAPKKMHVRGENKLSAWMYEDLPSGTCLLRLLISSDIKGWIPQKVIDQAMSSVTADTIKSLRVHMNSIRKF